MAHAGINAPWGANLEGDGPRSWLPGSVGLSENAQSAQVAQVAPNARLPQAKRGCASESNRIKPEQGCRVTLAVPQAAPLCMVARRLERQVEEPERRRRFRPFLRLITCLLRHGQARPLKRT